MKTRLVPCGVVAQLYAVTANTVRGWCRDGRVIAERTPGGEWRVLVDERGKPVTAEA